MNNKIFRKKWIWLVFLRAQILKTIIKNENIYLNKPYGMCNCKNNDIVCVKCSKNFCFTHYGEHSCGSGFFILCFECNMKIENLYYCHSCEKVTCKDHHICESLAD